MTIPRVTLNPCSLSTICEPVFIGQARFWERPVVVRVAGEKSARSADAADSVPGWRSPLITANVTDVKRYASLLRVSQRASDACVPESLICNFLNDLIARRPTDEKRTQCCYFSVPTPAAAIVLLSS